ncbi:MAG: hypothetical protein WC972_14080, partial [Trueperaceae bacterium]
GAVSTAEIEGPFPTRAGVSGLVQPGDQVIVDWRYGSPVIDLPIEGSERSAYSIIGRDLRTAQTTSHTTWVPLLEVSGIVIPAERPFWVEFGAEVITVGGGGSTDKQLRINWNEGEHTSGLTLTAGDNVFGFPLYVTAQHDWIGISPTRGFVSLGTEGGIQLPVGEVNSIALEGRTNDTGEGNDIVVATTLTVKQ